MKDPKDIAQQLGHVADALVDSLMALSDQELVDEVRDEGEDPDALAIQAAGIISAAVLQSGKSKMALARAAYQASKAPQGANILKLPINEKRQILERFATNDKQLGQKLTLAARNGDAMSEAELDSFLRDLRDLGAIDDEGCPT